MPHFELGSHHGRALEKVDSDHLGTGVCTSRIYRILYCFVQAETKDEMNAQLQRDMENLKAEAFAV